MHVDRPYFGAALMIGFCCVAPLTEISAKLASATISAGQITAARFLVQAALMAPVALAMGLPLALRPRLLALSALRAGCLVLSAFMIISAVAVMPVADALAIVFVEPFILLLLGWAVFGEAVGPRRFTACALGFAGALLVIRPSLAVFGPVALYPLGTAVFFALYMIVTRVLSRSVHPVTMQVHTAVLGFAIWLPLLLALQGSGVAGLRLGWPQGAVWAYLVGVGAASAVSHIAITYALKFAPSATLAPLHYLEIVSAVFFGYLVFGDFPGAMTWAGIAVITGSGLYVIHRERQLARRVPLPLP